MARYKPNEFAQNLLIPISLQEQVMPGSLEYAICTLVDERMDMSLFDEKYRNDDIGTPCIRSPDSAKGSTAGVFTGADLVKEDRAGVPGERGVHGTEQRAVS